MEDCALISPESKVHLILRDRLFIDCLEKTAKWEQERIFCRHDMAHLLDVARLAMLECLETGEQVLEEVIYGAGLLHDIGRFRQYEDNTPHEIASAALAPELLSRCGYTEEETAVMIEAIKKHRDASSETAKGLTGLLYRADKMSRCCFACKARDACDWNGRKKNQYLKR